jgi:hypothetical protein
MASKTPRILSFKHSSPPELAASRLCPSPNVNRPFEVRSRFNPASAQLAIPGSSARSFSSPPPRHGEMARAAAMSHILPAAKLALFPTFCFQSLKDFVSLAGLRTPIRSQYGSVFRKIAAKKRKTHKKWGLISSLCLLRFFAAKTESC